MNIALHAVSLLESIKTFSSRLSEQRSLYAEKNLITSHTGMAQVKQKHATHNLFWPSKFVNSPDSSITGERERDLLNNNMKEAAHAKIIIIITFLGTKSCQTGKCPLKLIDDERRRPISFRIYTDNMEQQRQKRESFIINCEK